MARAAQALWFVGLEALVACTPGTTHTAPQSDTLVVGDVDAGDTLLPSDDVMATDSTDGDDALPPGDDHGDDAPSDDGADNDSGADVGDTTPPTDDNHGGDTDTGSTAIPTNDHATARAHALFARLDALVETKGALFGQQNATSSSRWGSLSPAPDHSLRSDIQSALIEAGVDGAAHPAVFGFNAETCLYSGDADDYRTHILDADRNGGIITIHWPMANIYIGCARSGTCSYCAAPLDDNCNREGFDPIAMIRNNVSFVDDTGTTQFATELFDAELDRFAAYLATLVDVHGAPIPVIFRPFHEMNALHPGPKAHWWAGRDAADYAWVWRHMVDRLRIEHGLNQLLYAFAPRGEVITYDPPATNTPDELAARLLTYWPEEANPVSDLQRYVDIVSFDGYLKDSDALEPFANAIDTTYAVARAPARIVPRINAIAEAGRKDGLSAPTTGGPVDYQDGPFWTERLLPMLSADDGARWQKIAFLLTWSNSPRGYFSTYPCDTDGTCASAAVREAFVAWFNLPETLFLDSLQPGE